MMMIIIVIITIIIIIMRTTLTNVPQPPNSADPHQVTFSFLTPSLPSTTHTTSLSFYSIKGKLSYLNQYLKTILYVWFDSWTFPLELKKITLCDDEDHNENGDFLRSKGSLVWFLVDFHGFFKGDRKNMFVGLKNIRGTDFRNILRNCSALIDPLDLILFNVWICQELIQFNIGFNIAYPK